MLDAPVAGVRLAGPGRSSDAAAGAGFPPGTLVGDADFQYHYYGQYGACSVQQRAESPQARYGDFGPINFSGWVVCGAPGPVSITTQASLWSNTAGGALNWYPVAWGNSVSRSGWEAASTGTYRRSSSATELPQVRQTVTLSLPHDPNTRWASWLAPATENGCTSYDQWTVRCTVVSATFPFIPDVPNTSCAAWPAPSYCMFLPARPANVYPPSVSGTPRDGRTLTAFPGTWDRVFTSWPTSSFGTPVVAAYQWYRCAPSCSAMTGAASSSYTLGRADVGATFKVKVTAYGSGGYTDAYSANTTTVQAVAPSNTAPPVVAGVPQEGNTLVSHVGQWDGTPTINYAYQWQRCDGVPGSGCIDILGALGANYILTASDVGKGVRVRVTGSNAAGSGPAVVSPAAGPVQAGLVAPSNTAPPTISGVARDGQTLTATTGAWTRSPVSHLFQWQRCSATCTDIAEGKQQSYTAGHGDVGHTLRVLVTAVNGGGPSAPASSAASAAVAALVPSSKVAPAVIGAPAPGQTLRATDGVWEGSPATLGYQWQSCDASGSGCTNLANASGQSYTVRNEDGGRALRVVVSATNPGGSASAPSAPTPAVPTVLIVPVNQSAPTISGTPRDGQTLSASTGSWSNSPVTYLFQWQRCFGICSDIPGAKQATYTAGRDDVNYTLQVLVTAVNGAGTSAPAPSAQTSAVSALAPSNRVAPAVVGVPSPGQTLRATDGVWDGTSPAFAYQWQICDANGTPGSCQGIAGQTNQTHVVKADDSGRALRVVVTAVNAAGP
ncbi:MAG TPA: hypothetical protein VNB64_00480, partial [Solirubrobacteraceae bacterium]|nr:hypothetical protein [Solirubrobacteraceae bacterium]